MDKRSAERLTQLIEGGWAQKMGDARLAALTQWFMRTEATEDDCREAVNRLMNSDEFPPTPKKLYDALRLAGAVGPPQFGVGDPRVLTAIEDALKTAAGNTARIQHITMREAYELIRDTTVAILGEVSAMGDSESEERGYWTDRLAVVNQLMRGEAA
jgi:hypothetical protein